MKLSTALPVLTTLVVQSLSTIAAAATTYFPNTNDEAYTDWLGGASYSKSAFLESRTKENGVALHWTVNDTHIDLAVVGVAGGWIGFGLAESGSMKGADTLMYTVSTGDLIDSYVLDTPETPTADSCQNWVFYNSTVDGDFIIFEASRLLDTGDSQDRVIIDDSDPEVAATRVIAAWGDSPSPSFQGPDNHCKRIHSTVWKLVGQ